MTGTGRSLAWRRVQKEAGAVVVPRPGGDWLGGIVLI